MWFNICGPMVFVLQRSSSGNSAGSGSDHREINRISEGEAMKRTASPTLPDGATQAKYEPLVCNGEIDKSGSFHAVNAAAGADSLKVNFFSPLIHQNDYPRSP